MQGWALAVQGQHDKGQAQLCRGLAAWRATGAEVMQPYYLTLLADLHRIGGQANEGLSLVAEALTLVEKNRERLWEAEIHRLKGELLLSLSSDNYTAAESCFQKALEISRHQEAKSLELRAATSLANLWQSQGKREGSAYVIITGILVVYGRV
jgi:predicted ATPase